MERIITPFADHYNLIVIKSIALVPDTAEDEVLGLLLVLGQPTLNLPGFNWQDYVACGGTNGIESSGGNSLVILSRESTFEEGGGFCLWCDQFH